MTRLTGSVLDKAGGLAPWSVDITVTAKPRIIGTGFFALPTATALQRAGVVKSRFFRNTYFAQSQTYQHDPTLVAAAGFETLLNVHNVFYLYDGTNPPPASSPLTDKATFQAQLAVALDAVRPTYLFIENEAGVKSHFAGTALDYQTLYLAALEVGRAYGVPVGNDGPVSASFVGWLYLRLLQDGRTTDAEWFWALASEPGQTKPVGPIKGDTKAWYDAYALGDVFNFHCYWTEPQTVVFALRESTRYLGLPSLTNEWGFRGTVDATALMTAMLSAFRDGGALVAQLWSVDRTTQSGEVDHSLFDPNGTLRPIGATFRDFT